MSINKLKKSLYEKNPTENLYHYTTLTGLQGILSTRSLWATEIRYFSDFSEMTHTQKLLASEILNRRNANNSNNIMYS